MFFEIAVLHLFGKFLETHLWKSTFQQSCHHMLATMLKKFILWGKFFKVFHESLKYSCCNEHQGRKIWTSKNKPNNSKGAGSLCLNYDRSRICFCVSCKSMKRKSWCPRMVTDTHTKTFCSKYHKIFVAQVTIFEHCTLKGWKNNGQIHILGKVHCDTFFNPKTISCVSVSRSKTSRGVQK